MAEIKGPQIPKHTEYAAQSDIPFQKVDHLGQGAYAVVDKVQRHSHFYARKTFTVPKHLRRRLLEQISQEIKMMASIEHIHTVRLVETYACKLEYAMIMEPVADGNLADFIHDMAEGPRDSDRLGMMSEWFRCLVAGIAHLHSKNIHHRDVKPQNILYLDRKILLTDFGIAREFVEKTLTGYTAASGTRNYWAPELDEEIRPGRKADVFSLGVVFLEMLTVYLDPEYLHALWSCRPYSKKLDDVYNLIFFLEMEHIGVDWYPSMTFVCRNMLQRDKDARPYADALAACWFYQPYAVMPPSACNCMTSLPDVNELNIRGMSDARVKAEASRHQLALQLLMRRGPAFDGAQELSFRKEDESVKEEKHLSEGGHKDRQQRLDALRRELGTVKEERKILEERDRNCPPPPPPRPHPLAQASDTEDLS